MDKNHGVRIYGKDRDIFIFRRVRNEIQGGQGR